MVITKKVVSRFIFMCALSLSLYLYLMGSGGIMQIGALAQENKTLEMEIAKIEHACADLEKQINDWQNDSYYLEQYAREHLQMARADEEIFFIE